jgi:hypothetical protein
VSYEERLLRFSPVVSNHKHILLLVWIAGYSQSCSGSPHIVLRDSVATSIRTSLNASTWAINDQYRTIIAMKSIERKSKDSNGYLMLMLCRSVCSWALIVGAALLALMILGPFVLTIDRSEMTKTIVESKG